MPSIPRTTVPMPLVLDDEARWPEVIRAMRRIGAGRAMLYTSMQPVQRNSIKHYRQRLGAAADQDPVQMALAPDLRFYDLWSELFAERRAQIQAAGIPEVGVWFAQTLGHGSGVSGAITAGGQGLPFQTARDPRGAETLGLWCPLCRKLHAYLGEALTRISRARPAIIMFDDDFRLANHGTILRGCCCPLHQAELRRQGVPAMAMDEVARLVTSGDPNPVRTAWWKVQDAAMVAMATALGEAVHAVDPAIRVGTCFGAGEFELTDLFGVLRAMAGGNRPFGRTGGAPYHGSPAPNLGNNFESIRLQRAWLREAMPDLEDMCEGDTFPHLAIRCPAAGLDAYLQLCYASGAPQVLTYALSYMSPLHFEAAYIDLLERQQPRYDAIQRLIPADCRDLGLSIPWRAKPERSRRLEACDQIRSRNDPHPHKLCAQLGIPVAHGDDQGPVLLVDWQVELASDAELAGWAARGLLVDAPAALALQRRGIACGLLSATTAIAPNSEHFAQHPLNGPYAGGAMAMWSCLDGFYHRCTYRPEAELLTTLRAADDRMWGPGVALWQDPTGRRVAILPWNLRSLQSQTELQLMVSHARRWQLHRVLGWIGRRPLAATVDGTHAQVMVRQLPDRSRTVVTVCNSSFDPLSPVLRLDPRLGRPATVELLGPEGGVATTVPAAWGEDGDALTLALPCRLPVLGFCAVSIRSIP